MTPFGTSRRSIALAALFAAPVLLVGAFGLAGLENDAQRARSRYLEQAGVLARAGVDALAETVADLGEVPGATEVRASSDGALLLDLPVHPRADAVDLQVCEVASREVDALDREGRTAEADARLEELAQRGDRAVVAAFATTWIAARERARGDEDAARRALERVVTEMEGARDERGLSYALAARATLAELDGDPPDVLDALHRDLLADRGGANDTATTALADRVAQRIVAKEPTRARELRERRAASDAPLALTASWSLGVSDWLARGAPGGSAVFDLVSVAPGGEGAGRLLVAAARDDEGFACTVAPLRAVASRATERLDVEGWRALGFAPVFLGDDGGVLAGVDARDDGSSETRSPDPERSATRRGPTPLEEVAVVARGVDLEGFLAGERARLRVLASFGAAALLASLAAAFAIVRGVRREQVRAREREGFVAAVTHELKAPLASIRLLAELLEGGDVDAERVKDFGRRTVRESDRLARLVDSVLRFARAREGRDAPVEAHDLVGAVRAAVEATRPLATDRGFDVRLAMPSEEPDDALAVRCDRDAIVSAISELIDNATKYGAPERGVDVALRSDGARALVEVADGGPGVPEAERERVFEPFRRLGDELVRERAGIGLGLALVRAVAESCGGGATCSAREGGGSVFTLELPLATIDAARNGR
ncbi:MAG: HAMP domain-containing sensor histidine kinase [Planctomycetota bacterium]